MATVPLLRPVVAEPDYPAVLSSIEDIDARKDRLLLRLLEQRVGWLKRDAGDDEIGDRRERRIILIAESMKARLWQEYDAALFAFSRERSQFRFHNTLELAA